MQPEDERHVAVGEFFVRFVRQVRPGYLLGRLEILGVDHHVEFTRVTTQNNEQVAWSDPADEEASGLCRNRFEDLCAIGCDGPFNTVQVPGFEGDYVCMITPYND